MGPASIDEVTGPGATIRQRRRERAAGPTTGAIADRYPAGGQDEAVPLNWP